MPYQIPNSLTLKGGLIAVGAAASLGLATQAYAGISSNVYIDPAKSFVLGGAQPGDFTVRGTNRGDVQVEVYVRDGDEDRLISTIAPGERFNAGFLEGEGAILKNTSSSERAHVKVRVTGTTRNLGMGYQGW